MILYLTWRDEMRISLGIGYYKWSVMVVKWVGCIYILLIKDGPI